jgi:hypothetical protein
LTVLYIDIGENDTSTFAGKAPGGDLSNPFAATCYQRDFIVDTHLFPSPVLVWRRLAPAVDPGRLRGHGTLSTKASSMPVGADAIVVGMALAFFSL